MLEERVVHLINADIDGELDPGERDELALALESSAEARTLQAELQRLNALMESLPEQSPPPELAGRIIEQIRLPRSGTKAVVSPSEFPPSKFSVRAFMASFQPAHAGLAFAAGLLLTVGFYEVARRDGSPADLSSMVGTMVANPSAPSGRQMDSVTISRPELSGTVSLSEVGEFLVLNFDLESVVTTEIEVGFAEAGLGFGGIAHAAAAGRATDESFDVSGGTLRVINQGRQAFSVFLPRDAREKPANQDGPGRQISIGISSGGAVLYTGALRG